MSTAISEQLEKTAEQLETTAADETRMSVLRTIANNPDRSLRELSEIAEGNPSRIYQAVNSLRAADLVSFRNDESDTRRYSITDAGREELGLSSDVQSPRSEEEDAEDVQRKLEKQDLSAIRKLDALAEDPHKLSESTQRLLVLEAIDEMYRTYGGIKKRVGFPAWFDMEPLLAGMVSDYVIREESKGEIVAFFRYEQKPLNFWRIGDGRIDAELDPDFVPRDETKKAEELASHTAYINYPDKPLKVTLPNIDDDADDFDPDEDRPVSAFETKVDDSESPNWDEAFTGKGVGRGKGRLKQLDLAEVERIASTVKTKAEIAKALGFSSGQNLHKRLVSDADVKAAYDRGRRKFSESVHGPERETAGAKEKRERSQPKTTNCKQPDLDVAEVERLAREGYKIKDAAAELGLQIHNFKNYIKSGSGKGQIPAVRDAWYRGKKQAEASGVPRAKTKPVRKPVKGKVKRQYKKRDNSGNNRETSPAAASLSPDKLAAKNGDILSQHVIPPHVSDPGQLSLAVGYASIELHKLVEDLGFNIGTAIVCLISVDGTAGIDSAIWMLEREKTRRANLAEPVEV